jgi:hypothetical protein
MKRLYWTVMLGICVFFLLVAPELFIQTLPKVIGMLILFGAYKAIRFCVNRTRMWMLVIEPANLVGDAEARRVAEPVAFYQEQEARTWADTVAALDAAAQESLALMGAPDANATQEEQEPVKPEAPASRWWTEAQCKESDDVVAARVAFYRATDARKQAGKDALERAPRSDWPASETRAPASRGSALTQADYAGAYFVAKEWRTGPLTEAERVTLFRELDARKAEREAASRSVS